MFARFLQRVEPGQERRRVDTRRPVPLLSDDTELLGLVSIRMFQMHEHASGGQQGAERARGLEERSTPGALDDQLRGGDASQSCMTLPSDPFAATRRMGYSTTTPP
jgi:hypothetical protein